MITCRVCGMQHDDLAVVCSSCGGYLQSKVDSLNLFETLWQLVESPGLAFKRIVLSRHKNYLILLSGLVGINVVFAVFWLRNLGGQFSNLLTLLGAGILIGIPVGVAFVSLLSVVISLGIRVLGRAVSVRNVAAVVAYAGMPLVLALMIIFPLEIAVFGMDFFGNNPPPMVINPLAYWALLGFDSMALLWSLILLYRGVSALTGFGQRKALMATVLAVAFLGAGAFAAKTL